MRLLLVNPGSTNRAAVPVGIPTGLLAVGSLARSLGCEVRLIDAPIRELSDEAIAAEAEAFSPDWVGMGPMTCQLTAAARVATLIRARLPRARFLLGGPHASFAPEDTFALIPEAELIVRGEGEGPFTAFLAAERAGRTVAPEDGFAIRGENGEIIVGPLAEPVDPAKIAAPDPTLVPLDLYAKRDEGEFGPTFSAVRVLSGRGCTSRCHFCLVHRVNPGRVRNVPVEAVIAFLRAVRRAGIRFFKFADDSFGADRAYALDLAARMADARLDLRFEIETRLDLLDPELLDRLVAVGLEGVWFGIESFDDAVRERVVKGIRRREIERGVALLKEKGVRACAFLMAGLPGQTAASVLHDAGSAAALDLDLAVFSVLTPFPGTDVAAAPERFGLRVIDLNPDHYTEMQPVVETDWMTAEEIARAVRDGYAAFYLRDGYVDPRPHFRARMRDFVKNVILAPERG